MKNSMVELLFSCRPGLTETVFLIS